MLNLADIYRLEGKYTQAEPLYTQVLARRREVFGPEQADTLQSMEGLALLYRDTSRYRDAHDLYSTVVNASRRVLGVEHPYTLDRLMGFSQVLLAQQKYVEAEAALRETLKGDESARPEAWQRFQSQSLLGASLAGQKKFAEAEGWLLSGYEG